MKQKPKIGGVVPIAWLALGGAFAVLFLVQGSRSIIGVALKPIIAEFGWSRGAFSLVLFLHMAIFALMLPVVGRHYDRYGAKWVVIFSSVCLAVGYLGITVAQSLGQFLVLYGVLAAIGFGGCSITLFAAVVSKLFQQRRGLAVSLALAGGPVGQFVMVPPATDVIDGIGWRWVFVVLALMVLGVSMFVALALLKAPQPQQTDHFVSSRPDPHTHSPVGSKIHLTLRQAMRTPSFWLFTMLMAVCGGGDYLVITHLVPMVTDYGITNQTAGSMLAWFGLMGMLGLIVTGPITDRLGNKWPAAATFVLRFGLFVLILQTQSVAAFYVFALLFGFTMFITAPITTTLLARLYGLTHIGLISGVVTTVHHFSGGLWAWLGGVTHDRTGSYQWIFAMYAGACLIALTCGLLIKEQRHRVAKSG